MEKDGKAMMQRTHVGTDHEMRGVQVCHHADGIRLCLSTILVDMDESAPNGHVMQEKSPKKADFSRADKLRMSAEPELSVER